MAWAFFDGNAVTTMGGGGIGSVIFHLRIGGWARRCRHGVGVRRGADWWAAAGDSGGARACGCGFARRMKSAKKPISANRRGPGAWESGDPFNLSRTAAVISSERTRAAWSWKVAGDHQLVRPVAGDEFTQALLDRRAPCRRTSRRGHAPAPLVPRVIHRPRCRRSAPAVFPVSHAAG